VKVLQQRVTRRPLQTKVVIYPNGQMIAVILIVQVRLLQVTLKRLLTKEVTYRSGLTIAVILIVPVL